MSEIEIDEEPQPRGKRPSVPPVEIPVNEAQPQGAAPVTMGWEKPPAKVLTQRQTATLQMMCPRSMKYLTALEEGPAEKKSREKSKRKPATTAEEAGGVSRGRSRDKGEEFNLKASTLEHPTLCPRGAAP